MPDNLRTTRAGDRLQVRSESERIIDARIMPWDVVAQTVDGPERFSRGAFADTDPATVALEAIGPHGAEAGVALVGRALALEDRDDGEYASFRVSNTRAGDELLTLVRDGVYREVSAVFVPIQSRSVDGVAVRDRVSLRRVGVVERGAYPGAAALAVRSLEGSVMPEPIPDPTPDPAPPDPPGSAVIRTTAANADALAELRADMVGRMVALEARGAVRPSSPMAAWSSFGEYLRAAVEDPAVAVLMARAMVDQVTTDNPGVMAPSYLTTVFGIIARSRPAITGLGGARSLGDSGMSLHWPYFDGDLSVLVGKQPTEKTDITSVKVSIKDGSTAIDTFAGGSDVSYQLIRRSSPSYLEAYGRIMSAAWSLVTEKEFETDLAAVTGGTVVYDPAAPDPSGALLRAAFFEASAKVNSATGAPATLAIAAPDAFGKLGAALTPSAYGTANLVGTAQASTLRVNVSGLEVVEGPYLPAGTIIWTNGEAAGWHEDGPFVATAEDVAKLGQNRAIWSMGATGVYLPAGIVKNTLVAGRGARA